MNRRWIIAGGAVFLSTAAAVGVLASDTINLNGNKAAIAFSDTAILSTMTPVSDSGDKPTPIPLKTTKAYTKIVSASESKEYALPEDIPDDPVLKAQMQSLFKTNSFAETDNYINLPRPPVGDYRPGAQWVYLNQKELDEHLPTNGINYPHALTAINKDKDGRYYIQVLGMPSQELIEWAQLYNKKIPGYQDALTSLSGYENMMLNQNYVNEKWWKEIRSEIEGNLRAYEKWFFSTEEDSPAISVQKPDDKAKPFTYEIVNPAQIEFGAKAFIRDLGGFSYWKVSDGYMLIIGRGQKGSPGYGIKINSVEEDDTGKIVINVQESFPQPGMAYDCVITYPHIYVKINTDNQTGNFTVINQNGKEYPYYEENSFTATATVEEISYDPQTRIPQFLTAVPDSRADIIGKYFVEENDVRFNFYSSISHDSVKELKKGDKVKITYSVEQSRYYAKSIEKIN